MADGNGDAAESGERASTDDGVSGSDRTRRSRDGPSTERRAPTRPELQRRLESIVRNHRFTIAVVFPLVGAITLVGSAEGLLPEALAYNALLLLVGTAVMRSPLVVGILPRVDRWALGCLALLTLYTYAIEIVGVRTDWPYGAFEYEISLGPMIAGDVPLALPLFFIPLVINASLLSLLLLGRWRERWFVRLPVAVAFVVAIDVVLDPAAVAVGFWSFEQGGFYEVPLSNYVGWVLSGTVAVILVDLAFERASLLERVRECEFVFDDLVSFVLLWGSVNLLYGNWIAAGVAGLFCLGLFRTGRYDLATLQSAVPNGTSR